MLWVVIFLPFLLLRIFLDYASNISLGNNAAWKYLTKNANKILPSNDFFTGTKIPPTQPPSSPAPGYFPTGAARELPFSPGKARAIPIPQAVSSSVRSESLSKPISQTYTTNTQNIQNAKPQYKSEKTSLATSQLVNLSIPTMRDVARYETSRLTSQVSRTK